MTSGGAERPFDLEPDIEAFRFRISVPFFPTQACPFLEETCSRNRAMAPYSARVPTRSAFFFLFTAACGAFKSAPCRKVQPRPRFKLTVGRSVRRWSAPHGVVAENVASGVPLRRATACNALLTGACVLVFEHSAFGRRAAPIVVSAAAAASAAVSVIVAESIFRRRRASLRASVAMVPESVTDVHRDAAEPQEVMQEVALQPQLANQLEMKLRVQRDDLTTRLRREHKEELRDLALAHDAMLQEVTDRLEEEFIRKMSVMNCRLVAAEQAAQDRA